MTSPCPACGAEMEFSERAVVLRAGTCPSCAKEFAFVEGSTLTAHLADESEPTGAVPVGAPVVVAEDAPECEECGAPLLFRSGRGGAILAVCEDCDSSTVLRPEGEVRERGPPRREPAPERPGAGGGPRSRPCRRCGAPLHFTTGDDGVLVGECESCGNRFTLPPRRDEGRPFDRRGPPRFRGSGYRPRERTNDRYPYRRSGRDAPSRPRERRRERDSDDAGPRRRRRRSEE
jgi:DNA-directed RNA polymerase subunit M/transcription elongation factor TFIIS